MLHSSQLAFLKEQGICPSSPLKLVDNLQDVPVYLVELLSHQLE